MTAHKTIYLQPECPECAGDEHLWCQDDMGPCECGKQCLIYVLAEPEDIDALPSNENIADQPT